MTLLIDELYPDVVFEQNIRIKKTISCPHIRPWIYKQGTLQDGELTLEVWQGADLLKTAIILHTVINEEIPGTYAHGQIRFDLDPLQLNHNRSQEWTEYTLKIYMANHTRDENNFIGTSRRYELKFYDTYGDGVVDGEPPNDFVEPLGIELYRWRY
jgi:hypothetical protein